MFNAAMDATKFAFGGQDQIVREYSKPDMSASLDMYLSIDRSASRHGGSARTYFSRLC